MKLRSNLLILSTTILLAGICVCAETLKGTRHSTGACAQHSSAVANADVQRTFAAYREIRNAYIPQLTVGSGLGYSYGFPLTLEGSAPAIVNVVAQSTVFNPAQRQFQNAAKTEWRASQLQDKDQRNAVIQDAMTHASSSMGRRPRLQEDETQASKLEKAVAQRLQEGVDSAVDLNKAKLAAARARLRITEARGAADVLCRHLSVLTGLPVLSIEIASDTIPAMPAVSSDDDLPAKAVASSPAIQSADQHAIAEAFRASGEHRALLPSLDLAAQYARLSKYNNYDQYYKNFQPDNATIGMSFRFPIFNASQRARAQGAAAEALKARKQAEAARDKVSEETPLQRAVEQLRRAREVATGVSARAVRLRRPNEVDAGTGTLHDIVDARGRQ
jgi:outer membrane protein TolC